MNEASLVSLPLNEMRELWPKSAEGALCARLLQRYVSTLHVDHSLAAQPSMEAAPFNVGRAQILASLVRDFAMLEITPEPAKDVPAVKGLNYFRQPDPEPKKP